ncbi:MAG: papain family cysteine protease [Siphoviridae sp. cttb18]|nr:MAG: papain family cysteine protease [Siphoviridae sp. cttb18]
MEHFISGAVIDTRTEEEKAKDKRITELVASLDQVNWVEKPQSAWRKFPIFQQNGSGSCVYQTISKMKGIFYWLKNQVYVHFSATHGYQRRANRPGTGMGAVDAFNIAKQGTTLEELVPSQNMNDAQMDSIIIPQYKQDVGKVFAVGEPIFLPVQDIEAVASVIQKTGKAVMVWFYFGMNEWNQAVPQIVDPALGLIGAPGLHSVTAVDFTLYQGKKALIIEDSWGAGVGINGQRVITEDFYKVRNWFAGYFMNFKFEEQTMPKPIHTFTTELKYGDENYSVKMLQEILKYEGLFPINTTSTGKYYGTTAESVLKFQRKYAVAPESELTMLAGMRVGPKTIAKLNELYSQ